MKIVARLVKYPVKTSNLYDYYLVIELYDKTDILTETVVIFP